MTEVPSVLHYSASNSYQVRVRSFRPLVTRFLIFQKSPITSGAEEPLDQTTGLSESHLVRHFKLHFVALQSGNGRESLNSKLVVLPEIQYCLTGFPCRG